MVLASLLAAGLVHNRWRSITHWYELVRLRHSAMTHTVSAGDIMMSQSPGDTRESWGDTISSRYARFDRLWRETEDRLVPSLPVRPGSSVTLLLHEVRSPAGHRRIIAVNLSPSWASAGTMLAIDIRLFEPGTIMSPRFVELQVKEREGEPVRGHIPGFPGSCMSLATICWGNNFTLYAGQADPKNGSRFIIPYDINGTPGQFIGQLMDDDSVSMTCSGGEKMPKRFDPPATTKTAK
jgi:hypothetical protein